MNLFAMLFVGLLVFDCVILGLALIGYHLIKPLFPHWWERNIVADYSEVIVPERHAPSASSYLAVLRRFVLGAG